MGKLKNRRRMAIATLCFAIVWYPMVFWTHALSQDWGAGVISAYLGVPGMLAGLNIWRYLKACEQEGGD